MKSPKKEKLLLKLKKPIGDRLIYLRTRFYPVVVFSTCIDLGDKRADVINFVTYNLGQAVLILLHLRQERSSPASLCKVSSSNSLFYLQAKVTSFLATFVKVADQLLELINPIKLSVSFLRNVKPLDRSLNDSLLNFSPTRSLS